MAQTIKVKRGLSTNLPVSFEMGELAYATDTQQLYVGTGTGRVLINNPQFTLPDVGTEGAYYKVTTDSKGRVISGQTTLSITDIGGLGTAASKNIGTTNGTIPILGADGKLNTSVLPAIAISDTFVVATEAAMLAVTAQVGDIAIRTDLRKSFILKAEGASTLANWQELLTPTDAVTSVAGKTGVVTLVKSDVGLGNVDNTSDANKPISTATQTALNAKANATDLTAHTNSTSNPHSVTKAQVGLGNVDNTSDANKPISTATAAALAEKAPIASPTFTGTPKATTAAADTNTTQIATTAFVIGQASSSTPLGLAEEGVVGTSKKYARADHQHPMPAVIDGGTF